MIENREDRVPHEKRNHVLVNRLTMFSSNPTEVFLGKGALKIYSKFTGEQPCQSVIAIKLQSNFIEITFPHGYSPVNLLHIFRTTFLNPIHDGGDQKGPVYQFFFL